MSYRELVFSVDAQTAEVLGDALMELGALSIAVEDAFADTPEEDPLYGEPGMTPEVEAWNASRVQALFDQTLWEKFPQHTEAILAELNSLGLPIDTYEEYEVADQDWVKLTQSQFDPIQISNRVWVIPSWHAKPEGLQEGAICLAVDPGLAFGTGSHPTTKLCLQWLESLANAGLLQNASLMDYGCGSGILAIAAKKLGSGKTQGIDIDPQSVTSSTQNALDNEVHISFCLPNAISSNEKFDIVVANILANPLQVLAPAISNLVKPKGYLALSGILERQAQLVVDAYAPWVALSVWQEMDGWVCLAGSAHA